MPILPALQRAGGGLRRCVIALRSWAGVRARAPNLVPRGQAGLPGDKSLAYKLGTSFLIT